MRRERRKNSAEHDDNAPPEPAEPSRSPSYPFGIIGAAITDTFLMTIVSYFLYVIGIFLGLMVGS